MFESWYGIEYEFLAYLIIMEYENQEVKKYPGGFISGELKIDGIEKSVPIWLKLMEKEHLVYKENDRYYPMPDPDKTMIIYDTKNRYLKTEAEKLSKGLKEKGVSVTLKSVVDFTDEDKENYEIILLRGNMLDSDTSTKFSDISSNVKWDKSEGEIEIVHKADRVSSPVFVIGGKNEASVKTAVENYVRRYSTPQ